MGDAGAPKLHEGWVEKYASSKKWVKYWVVIRGNKLHCFKSSDTRKESNYVGYLGVDAPDAVELSSMAKGKYEFILHAAAGSIRFRCPTLEMRVAWVHHIREAGAINQLLLQGASGAPAPLYPSFPPVLNPPTLPPPSYPSGYAPPPPPAHGGFQPPPPPYPSPSYPSPSNARRDPLSPALAPSSSASLHLPSKPPAFNPSFAPPVPLDSHPSHSQRGKHAYEDAESFNPPWHFGKISRTRSEELLMKHGSEGYFLVRESESTPGDYTLSVLEEGVVKHYKIQKLDGKIYLTSDPDVPFDSLHDLIRHTIEASQGRAFPLDRDNVYRLEQAFADKPSLSQSYDPNAMLPGQRFALENPVVQPERRRPERQPSNMSNVSVTMSISGDENYKDPDLAHDYEYDEMAPELAMQSLTLSRSRNAHPSSVPEEDI